MKQTPNPQPENLETQLDDQEEQEWSTPELKQLEISLDTAATGSATVIDGVDR